MKTIDVLFVKGVGKMGKGVVITNKVHVIEEPQLLKPQKGAGCEEGSTILEQVVLVGMISLTSESVKSDPVSLVTVRVTEYVPGI